MAIANIKNTFVRRAATIAYTPVYVPAAVVIGTLIAVGNAWADIAKETPRLIAGAWRGDRKR